MNNPLFYERQRMRASTWNVPRLAVGRCAVNGRYCPLARSQLRRSSLQIVDGLRPNCPAIARTAIPARRRSAMHTRSSSDKDRGETSGLRALIMGG
jgi:hypothetical protein